MEQDKREKREREREKESEKQTEVLTVKTSSSPSSVSFCRVDEEVVEPAENKTEYTAPL